jgi:hypothetical protein
MIANLLLSLAMSVQVVSSLSPPFSHAVSSDGDEKQEELVLANYDLRALLPNVDGAGWEQSLLLPPAGRGRHPLPVAHVERSYEQSSGDVVMKIISTALEEEFLERYRDLSLQGEQNLMLLAPESTHQKVAGIIDALRAMASDSALIRVDVLSFGESERANLPGLHGNNVIAASEVDRLIAQAVSSNAQHQSFEMQLQSGRTTMLERREEISFLFDYDVEIAQGSFVFDPIVLQTQDGLKLLMRASPAGGGLALNCVLQSSVVDEEFEEHPISLSGMVGSEKTGMAVVEGPQVLQNPGVLMHGFSVNTFLPDGKAVLFASETKLAGGTHRQVVVLRSVGGGLTPYASHPVPGTGRKLLMVNSELFRSPWLETVKGPYRDGARRGHPLLTARLLAEPSHFFLGWMRNFAVWDRLGPWVVIVTDRSWDGDNEEKLQALVRGMEEPPALATVEIELQTTSGDRRAKLSLPLVVGTTAGAVVGKTHTVLADFTVEVAQFSAAADPFMVATFDGMALTLGVIPGRDHERVLVVSGAAQLVRKPAGEILQEGPALGRLELPRYDVLRLNERRNFPVSDGATRVKLGPVSSDAGMTLNVTVR